MRPRIQYSDGALERSLEGDTQLLTKLKEMGIWSSTMTMVEQAGWRFLQRVNQKAAGILYEALKELQKKEEEGHYGEDFQ